MPNNVSQISQGTMKAKPKLAASNQQKWYVRQSGMIGCSSINESVKIMGLILLAHLTLLFSRIIPTTNRLALKKY